MRYSDYEQRQMDIASGEELDRRAERRAMNKKEITEEVERRFEQTRWGQLYPDRSSPRKAKRAIREQVEREASQPKPSK